MIRFDHVTFEYPGEARPALDSVDWCVKPGSFTVVTGPSGSGKSTLARCVNGLIPHFRGGRFGGRVEVDGLTTIDHSTATLSRHVGFVSQVPEAQTVTDRVEDEIAFGLENLREDPRTIRLRVEEALDLFHLNALRRRRIDTLSGGERQRVVIASAMAMSPTTLVLDEPSSQLDPSSADEVFSILRRINHDLGTTIVLVEHRLDRVLGLAERLLILNREGAVERCGSPREAVSHLHVLPPLQQVAGALGWRPTPLTVREARHFFPTPVPRRDVEPEHVSMRPPGGQASVALENVSFSYPSGSVVDRLSLAFDRGSVTALMGRNGSGKSTLLKLMNGLLRPQSGRVLVNGRDIVNTSTTDLAQSIGYLPQNAATLLFNQTVQQELEFTLRCRGQTGDIPSMLKRFGLTKLSLRNPLDLSGGERLRTALAAILIGHPAIVLLDEPTRGIDRQLKTLLGDILCELAQRGVSLIVATHDVDLVAEYAQRVVILGDGEVVADGTPHEVLPGSLTFATQLNRVFGGKTLTVSDVLESPHAARPPV